MPMIITRYNVLYFKRYIGMSYRSEIEILIFYYEIKQTSAREQTHVRRRHETRVKTSFPKYSVNNILVIFESYSFFLN